MQEHAIVGAHVVPSTTSRKRRIARAPVIGAFCLVMAASGVLFLLAPAGVVHGLARLGYPPYLATILGVAKLLGVMGLLQRRSRKLREWAYAGFTFDLAGAVASHVFAHDRVESIPALLALALLFTSYRLRERS